jgi:hypothetical protein
LKPRAAARDVSTKILYHKAFGTYKTAREKNCKKVEKGA